MAGGWRTDIKEGGWMVSLKILMGAKVIREYIGIASKPLYRQLLEMGLPVQMLNARHVAHVDNLDEWFRNMTNVPLEGATEEEGDDEANGGGS